MVRMVLGLFTSGEKVDAMLRSPIIEMIFMVLFGLFMVTLLVHVIVYVKIRKTRNYVQETGRMDIEPLQSIKKEFDVRQSEEAIGIETFVQERFSKWRMLQLPVINLIKLVQMTISVFILLGVLGTFIGLTISLGNMQLENDQLIENVVGVLSGIDVAFYTSIIGMSFSLIMTVLVRVLNTEYLLTDLMLMVESLLEGEEQQGMTRMIAVSEDIHTAIQSLERNNQQALNSIVDAFAGFKDYIEGLQQSAEDLATFNDGLRANVHEFQELFHQMTVVTDSFGEGTTQLNENFTALFAYFKETDRKNERMANAFEHSYATFQDIAKAQMNSLQGFDESVTDVKEFTTSLLDKQAEVERGIETHNAEASRLVETMASHNQTFKEVFGKELDVKMEGISTYLAEVKTGFDNVGKAFGSLPQALEIVNHTQKEQSHLLGERFKELKEFNQSFHQHLKDQVSGATKMEEQMQDATRTFEGMALKNHDFLNDVNQVIKSMKQNVGQREQELTSNLNALKDTLVNHTSSVENMLSQRLDTVIRNMDQGLYVVTDGMNRELIEMRRISEEMNQNHMRLVQQSLQELGREIQTFNRQLGLMNQQPIRQGNTIGMNRDEY